MKFDRQLQPATETLWVVSYGGKKFQVDSKMKNNIYSHALHIYSAYLVPVANHIAISQWKIIQFSCNFVHSSRFLIEWTSRDQKWKSCIGQTPSSTEHISCSILMFFSVQNMWIFSEQNVCVVMLVSSVRRYSLRGAIRFVRRSFVNEGFFSLWRGNSATLVRIMPYAAIQYASHEQWKHLLNRTNDRYTLFMFFKLKNKKKFIISTLSVCGIIT